MTLHATLTLTHSQMPHTDTVCLSIYLSLNLAPILYYRSSRPVGCRLGPNTRLVLLHVWVSTAQRTKEEGETDIKASIASMTSFRDVIGIIHT